ncbi:MAG: sigma-54 dependent transcriptional regulator [Thermodesulfobacteriota bacterium]|nr:sigma-54 dependent transcriptional regulator [Thermodesulfobacteriota bacterium]
MPNKQILIIDDEENMRHMLSTLLGKEGFNIVTASSGKEGMKCLEKADFDVILCDVRMPEMDGLAFLKELQGKKTESPVIMMSGYGTIDTAIEAMKLGAYDYISKPFKPDEIILTLKKAEERERLRRENIFLKSEIRKEYSFGNIIAKSPGMRVIFDTIKKISGYKTTVLLTGESGTGKELIARAIHYNSTRSEKPFVAVNCGAIPENLLESELFGHVKGAFTDAHKDKKGLFEETDGGTLFLDEISELPFQLQVKLLRILQEEEVRRLGDNKSIKVDVRIIAATLKNLSQEVEKGDFRADLFYRLNVLPIDIPPLRERKEDIPLLVDHFIQKYNGKLGTNIQGITKDALNELLKCDWSGNVRELENTLERAMVLGESDRIENVDVPPKIGEAEEFAGVSIPHDELSIKKTSQVIERHLITKALKKTAGNRTQAAKLLEISHRALLYKIKEYAIKNED